MSDKEKRCNGCSYFAILWLNLFVAVCLVDCLSSRSSVNRIARGFVSNKLLVSPENYFCAPSSNGLYSADCFGHILSVESDTVVRLKAPNATHICRQILQQVDCLSSKAGNLCMNFRFCLIQRSLILFSRLSDRVVHLSTQRIQASLPVLPLHQQVSVCISF